MPDADEVSFCASLSVDANADGFFIAPFNTPLAQACRIPFEFTADDVLKMDASDRPLPQLPSASTDKAEYLTGVAELIGRLKARGNAKTVISTVKTEPMPAADPAKHIALIAKHLFDNGKGLFCNCWHHPALGLWMGATPELLLSVHGHRLRTMALAGTTLVGHKWDEKNRTEHKFVADYIAGILTKPYISPTCEYQFGQLKHLRTDFEAILPDGANINAIVDALNPTPALCGYPKEQALSDIADIERHKRQCYGGLVGIISNGSLSTGAASVDAFVNIRCARFGAGQCQYFSGGGITADSVPEAEWAEAQAKRQQLINFFNFDNL